MKARRRPFVGTLDSLLDTTTNVVGILVIVLVITQLGVRGAVDRIRANLPVVTEAMLAAAQVKAEDLRQVAAMGAVDESELMRQVEADQAAVATMAKSVAELKEQSVEAARVTEEMAAQKQLADEEAAHVADLQQQLAAAREQLEKLKALAAAPAQPPRPPAVVHLPNPRAAPQGSSAIIIVCRGQRVMPVPITGLRNLAEARIRALRLPADADGAVDGQPLIDLFERTDIGNRQFRLRLRIHNATAYLVFEPRDGAGETIADLDHAGSTTWLEIRRADPRTRYARFLVWTDSFETYLAARSLADTASLPAGWEPMHPQQRFQISLADSVKVRQPPPAPPLVAPPPPPPPEKEPDKAVPKAPPKQPPPEPKPAPKPVPPPRPPLPQDVID